jgi:aminoglycoside phosphotransferase (APT) family kinase protein
VRILSVRHLCGGQSALTSAIRVESRRAGTRHWVILRRFVTDWYRQSKQEKARTEHAALSAIKRADVPAPRPLWVDELGEAFGVPATIQTRLTGRAWWPDAIAPSAARQMGEALGEVHACRPPPNLPETRLRVAPFLAPAEAPPSLLEAHPAGAKMWAALKSAGIEPLERDNVLLHGDYHAGNVLWRRGCLCGIVDWETAQSGPPGRDVAYTRMDCTITGGREMAAAFTDGYGETSDDLWFWELLAATQAAFAYRDWAPAWRAYGLTNLRLRTVRRRLDAFINRALSAAA